MKINILTITAACLVLSGCGWRKKSATEATGTQVYSKGDKKVYDEDLDAFVLEEDSNPLMAQEGQESLMVEGSESASLMVDDHKDSARYGLKTIYFDFDKSVIRPDQQAQAQHDLEIVKRLTSQGKTVVIEGHACNSAGSAVYNMMLSEKRARTIANYFIKNGVRKSKLKIVGRGSEMCSVIGGSREQQAPNRRVENYVLEAR